MELLGRDADLRAETQFAAVCEACRSVHIDRRTVNILYEFVGIYLKLGYNSVTVVGRVESDMRNSLIHIVNYLDCENVIQKFGREVSVRRLRSVYYFERPFAEAKLYGNFAFICSGVYQALLELRQEFGGYFFIHETYLLGVADRGAARFCVFNNIQCLFDIRDRKFLCRL